MAMKSSIFGLYSYITSHFKANISWHASVTQQRLFLKRVLREYPPKKVLPVSTIVLTGKKRVGGPKNVLPVSTITRVVVPSVFRNQLVPQTGNEKVWVVPQK